MTGQYIVYRNKGITVEIKNVFDFNKSLDMGPYAWPGGYPFYFITADGGVLSWKTAIDEQSLIRDAIIGGYDPQWEIVAMVINYEDNNLYCDHTGKKIESAYGDD